MYIILFDANLGVSDTLNIFILDLKGSFMVSKF